MRKESVKPSSFKDLMIWQRGMALAKTIHTLTKRFPPEERYGLSAQMRSAATSVPLNIAEGQCRRGTKEFLLHLSHAQGSLGELESQILYGVSVGYCSQSEAAPLCQEILELHKMVDAIQRRLSRRAGKQCKPSEEISAEHSSAE